MIIFIQIQKGRCFSMYLPICITLILLQCIFTNSRSKWLWYRKILRNRAPLLIPALNMEDRWFESLTGRRSQLLRKKGVYSLLRTCCYFPSNDLQHWRVPNVRDQFPTNPSFFICLVRPRADVICINVKIYQDGKWRYCEQFWCLYFQKFCATMTSLKLELSLYIMYQAKTFVV